jgi:hypothetical protein
VPLPFGGSPNNSQALYFALVNPKFEAPTKEMRAVLPMEVREKSWSRPKRVWRGGRSCLIGVCVCVEGGEGA